MVGGQPVSGHLGRLAWAAYLFSPPVPVAGIQNFVVVLTRESPAGVGDGGRMVWPGIAADGDRRARRGQPLGPPHRPPAPGDRGGDTADRHRRPGGKGPGHRARVAGARFARELGEPDGGEPGARTGHPAPVPHVGVARPAYPADLDPRLCRGALGRGHHRRHVRRRGDRVLGSPPGAPGNGSPGARQARVGSVQPALWHARPL